MGYARLLVAIFMAYALSGCAPVIPEEALKDVDRDIKPEDIVKRPEAYKGKKVVIGGLIISVENLEEKTYVEILQEGLNYRLRPVDPDESAGRFLISFEGFKDPAVYSKGKELTVAGTVEGSEPRKIGKTTYNYPVIKAQEQYLWHGEYRGREPSVGIGVGLGYTHID